MTGVEIAILTPPIRGDEHVLGPATAPVTAPRVVA